MLKRLLFSLFLFFFSTLFPIISSIKDLKIDKWIVEPNSIVTSQDLDNVLSFTQTNSNSLLEEEEEFSGEEEDEDDNDSTHQFIRVSIKQNDFTKTPKYRLKMDDSVNEMNSLKTSFLETDDELMFSYPGLVADYDFDRTETELVYQGSDHDPEMLSKNSNEIPNLAGSASALIDIGAKCQKRMTFVHDPNVMGLPKKVARFDKGTGFYVPRIKTLLPSDDQTTYTIVMRVKFYSVTCFGRILNTNFNSDFGFYVCDALRVYPLRAAPILISANVWHDVGLATNAQKETFIYFDGAYVTSVVASDQVWSEALAIKSDQLVFFNDIGVTCDIGGKEETTGEIARIQIYDRVLPVSVIKASMNRFDLGGSTYEYFPDCACEQLECSCEKICDCKGPCIGTGDLALGKPTAQPSVGWGGFPWYGNNGVRASNYGGNHCTHTGYEYEPWWRVDLGKETPISRVLVLNRGDCCASRLNGFEVRVGNDESSWKRNGICGKKVDRPGAGETITVECGDGISGRYVYIVIPGRHEYLHVCSVEVYYDSGFELGPCLGTSRVQAFAQAAAATDAANIQLTNTPSKDVIFENSDTRIVGPRMMTWIWSQKPTQNFRDWLSGTLAVLSKETFVLIMFQDFPPPPVPILNSKLRIYSSDHNTNCTQVSFFRILSRWDDTTVTWSQRPIIFEHPFLTLPWLPNQWIELEDSELNNIVQNWASSSEHNFGIAITCSKGASGIDGVGGYTDGEYGPRLILKF